MGAFEVRWEGLIRGTPREVWDAFTAHTSGWYWKINYEPWVGGAERGLAPVGGTVTAWEPARHFTTRSERPDGSANELDYLLEPRGAATHLRFTHRGAMDHDHDRMLDMCERHTEFYYHSLGEYVAHFAGRDAAYVAARASRECDFPAVRRALGVADDVAAGDPVRLTPAGPAPIDGVVDYATPTFLGVRAADALYRFYGRDAWGEPFGLGHHLFAADADEAVAGAAWQRWLDGVGSTEEVAG